MNKITVEDINNLYDEFHKYCENAEQSEFFILLMIDAKMEATLKSLKEKNSLYDAEIVPIDSEQGQADCRAMFRVVYKAIGKSDKAKEYED